MKKLFSATTALVLCSSVYGQNISVTNGWHLKGATENISNMSVFSSDCVSTVWIYNNGWKAYSADSSTLSAIESSLGTSNIADSINIGKGFWINATGTCTIDTNVEVSNQNVNSIKQITESELDKKTFVFNYTETLTLSFDSGSHEVIINGVDNDTSWSIYDTDIDYNGDSIGFQMDDGFTYIQFNDDNTTANIIKMSGNDPDATVLSESNNISFTSSWTYSASLSNRYINADNGNYHLYLDNGIYFELETGANWFMAMGEYSTDESDPVDKSIVLHDTDGSDLTIKYSSLTQGSNLQFWEDSSSSTITQTFDNFEKDGPFSSATYDGGTSSALEKFNDLSCNADGFLTNPQGHSVQLQNNVYFCHNNGLLYSSTSDQSTPYGIARLIGNKAYFVLDLYKYNSTEEDPGSIQLYTITYGGFDNSAYYTYLPFPPE